MSSVQFPLDVQVESFETDEIFHTHCPIASIALVIVLFYDTVKHIIFVWH